MTRSFSVLPLLLGSLLLSACGVTVGEACEGGGYLCSSEKEAVECRDNVWRALPCRGPSGCSEAGGSIQCDLAGSVAGDACAASAEGRGLCTADGKAVLECRMGELVQVKSCRVCSTTETRVVCEQ